MIDWFAGLVGYDAQGLKLGLVQVISPAGEITLQKEGWIKAMGSYESSVQLSRDSSTPGMRKSAEPGELVCNSSVYKLSGNPSKFLQGHNVFGPSVALLVPLVQAVFRRLHEGLSASDVGSCLMPAVSRNRVDVTTSIRMDSDAMVHEFIHHAQLETRSRHKHHQGGLTGSSTMTWGVSSKRWMITVYCKHCELSKHPLADPGMQADLLEYSAGLLRVELRLYTKELVKRETLSEALIWDFYDRIEVGVMKTDADDKAKTLRPPVRLLYEHWRDGHDVSPASGFIKRAAFYKYRKEILEATGQDISLAPVKKCNAVSREMFSTEWLRAHEVKEVPEHLQKYLWKPGEPSPGERSPGQDY